MSFSQEQFETLMTMLTSPPRPRGAAARPGPERREAPRKQARGPADLRVGAGTAARTFTVYVHDVSQAGLGIMSGRTVRVGSGVELLVSNGYDDLTLRCAVRHCTTLSVGLYGIGLSIVECTARQVDIACPATEAMAAWSGFFTAEAEASGRAEGF